MAKAFMDLERYKHLSELQVVKNVNIDKYGNLICPNCGEVIIRHQDTDRLYLRHKYCDECGQKVTYVNVDDLME